MGWQNVFASVLRAGNTVIINPNGEFVYNGPPGPGNLLYSILPSGGLSPNPVPFLDPYGNYVFPGETIYSASGPTSVNYALNSGPFGIGISRNPSGQGPANAWSQIGSFAIPPVGPQEAWQVEPGNFSLFNGSAPTVDPGTPFSDLFADTNGRPGWFTGGNDVTHPYFLDRSQTDLNTITVPGTSTIPSNITRQYPVDPVGGQLASSVYTLRTRFNGNTALNNQLFYINLNGTTTLLQTVAGNFVPGMVSGQAIAGWLEVEIVVLSATQVRVSLSGAIAIGGNQSNVTGCPITSGVINAAFSGGTIGLATAWAASNATQTITSFDSRFTRRG